jgi:tRNA1Val (adenine37-N6)-methyltransferase
VIEVESQSSVNLRPTFQYSQPDEYRFSHDSVFLAQAVFDLHKHELRRDMQILDLCAGCGIVGMDFLFHCRQEQCLSPGVCDFVEIQSQYKGHFFENSRRLDISGTELNYFEKNYSELLFTSSDQYDLIVCNPPYFQAGQGKLSDSRFKNRCRFYLDSDFETLLLAIVHVLKPTGSAYLLLRDLKDHNLYPLREAQSILAGVALIERVSDIRGTDLVRIKKLS